MPNTAESMGICDRYYEICKEHPLRIGAPIEKMPLREIISEADGRIELKKLKGVGTVFEVQSMPQGFMLRFIIQKRTTVETHITMPESVGDFGTLAILFLEAKKLSNSEIPHPPYPRPEAHSKKELIDIFLALKEVLLRMSIAYNREIDNQAIVDNSVRASLHATS
ncbi:MAG: hypothetical protein ACSHYA_17085 [Opitutaceae bacterium]